MSPVRRISPLLTGATALLLAAALAGCGTEHAGGRAAPAPDSPSPIAASPSASPYASPYDEQGPGDGAPHYAENHAFQSTLDLSDADRARGEAEVAKVKQGLAGLAEGRESTETGVRRALTGLGYADGTIDTGSFGPHRTSFILSLGTLCVKGSLDGAVNGLVNAEAHGRYMEGTGCVKPRGGH